MEQKKGWNYFFIDSLNQHIAINEITSVLYTEDKTRYSSHECNMLKSINYQIPLSVHILKKLFGGEIITL